MTRFAKVRQSVFGGWLCCLSVVALGIGVIERAGANEPLSQFTSEVFTPDGNIREFIKLLTCDKDSANAGAACTMDSQCTGGLCGDSQTYFIANPALEGLPNDPSTQDPNFGAIKAIAVISRGVFLRRDNSPEPSATNPAKQSGFRDRPAASGTTAVPTGFNIGRVFASYNPDAYGGEGAYFLAVDISAPGVMDSLVGTQPVAFDLDGDGNRNTLSELDPPPTISEVPSRASSPDGYGFEIDIDGDGIGEVGILIGERAISLPSNTWAIDPPIDSCTVDTDCTGAITCNTNTGFCQGQIILGANNAPTIVRRFVSFEDITGCLPGTPLQQAVIFLDANDDGLIDYRDFGVDEDVEIVVRHPDLLPQPPDPLLSCAIPALTNETPACIGFVYIADSFDDQDLGGGGEDLVSLIARFPVPDIEVSKEVKCVDDPDDAYTDKVSAVPGSTVEYRVTITNWGNRDLDVTLSDLFDCDAPASGSLVGGSCLPAGAFCTAFESAFQSGTEFSVDVGMLPAADQCAVGPGEPFVFSFQVLTGSVCGQGCSNQVSVNATTTQQVDPILAPREPSPDSPDGNAEEEDVDGDGIGDVADEFFIDVADLYKAIDTSREETVSADDNTAGVNFQCRDVTFKKQVRVLPGGSFTSCEDAAIIPTGASFPADVEYKFIVANNGDGDEAVTIQDADLCADIAATAGASFVDCPLCPSGQVVGNAPAGGSFMTSCVVRFADPSAPCDFVNTDNNRPGCQATNDIVCTPGGEGCHRNCATASALPVATGICDGAINLDSCSILCVVSECALNVTKTVRCVDGCGTKNPLGDAGDSLVADPGSWAEFEVAIENTGGVPIKQLCITDTLSCGWDVCGLSASIGVDDVSAALAGFAPDGVERCFDLSTRPLDSGEILSIRFNVQVPASFPILGAASDCRNDVSVSGFKSETDTGDPAATCTGDDSVDIDVRVPRYSCGKTVSVDLGDDGSVEIGATSFANITTATFPMRLTYSLSVSNTGEVDIADAQICDERLVADAIAAGIAVESCALCDGACDGAGDTCSSIGALAAGASATRTCELVVPDLGAWNLFASSDLIDSREDCYTNEAKGTGTVSQNCAPPGTPDTIETTGCQAAVCISIIPECPVTKAKFDIWNQNEVRFSGTHRCIYSWDQALLSRYTVGDIANHLTRARIHTNKGKARIDGISSPVVCGEESIRAPLLGVAAKIINFEGGDVGKAGRPLLGAGTEVGVIKYDLPGGPSGSTPSTGGLADESMRATISEKGSLLVYAKVEIKWDSNFNLIQDTFLSISNDFTDSALVQLYMVNGDQPVGPVIAGDPPEPVERGHLGCNSLDNVITLTGDQPTYWSAFSGVPAGVSPFSVLDPGFPPGRPDTDPRNPGGRVLRGYVLAWAVNGFSEEVRWNHLAGNAVIVNYRDGTAWEYETWNFKALAGLVEGDLLTVPLGQLSLDGIEYAFPPSQLILDFYTFGATLGSSTTLDTDLTLWAAIKDLRAP